MSAPPVGGLAEGAEDAEAQQPEDDHRRHRQDVRAVAHGHVDRQEAERAHEDQRDAGDRAPHVKRARRSCRSCRSRLANRRIASSPNTKPPMWAKYATPPPPPVGFVRSAAPKMICWTNQKPSTTSAGSSMNVKKKTMKINVTTRARGKSRM